MRGFVFNMLLFLLSIKSVLYFISRPVDRIRGFSRETLVEMTTNIESQERRRRENNSIGYAEHPRTGGTDDLETFFSIAYRYLGLLVALEQFKEKWQRLVRYVLEFHVTNISVLFYILTLLLADSVAQSSKERSKIPHLYSNMKGPPPPLPLPPIFTLPSPYTL